MYDSERNEWLESQRDTECCDFGTNQVLNEIEAVKVAILATLEYG